MNGNNIDFAYDCLYIYFMGKHQLQWQAQELSTNLEEIHKNFAYRMLVLEIRLYGQGRASQEKHLSTTQSITQLTQLYMRAVEVLEDKYCEGFEFFNFKIQNLLKKRSVIQELLRQNRCSLNDRQKTMKLIQKAEIKDRREEYDMRLSLENPTLSRQKVQELIKNSELRLNMIQSRIKTGLHQQDNQLSQRIRARKLKSESSTRDPKDQVEGFFQYKEQVQNSEQLHDKLASFQSKYQKSSKKTGKLGLAKRSKPNLFSSFSHIKF